jgi:transcriptional regulator of arginine metabolism
MINSKKAQLIIALQELLQKKIAGTQEDIREALKKQGFLVNQVMISRLLHKIGAIKMHKDDKIIYQLPTELVSITPNDSLKYLILHISHNESLIVIQTAPGSAQLVARLLDQTAKIGILGTVAGDDTIFIAPEKTKNIQAVFQKISKMLLG